MLRLLKSSWTVSIAGGLLYLATTAALLRPARFADLAPVPEEVKSSPNNSPSWSFRNPEFEQWVEELKHEREALAQRAVELQELQKRLEAERQEILTVTQTVHQLQMEFDKRVVRLKEQDMENLKRQTKVVSAMSPEGAAAMLNEMPEDQMVGVLFLLKPDAASLILDTLSKMGKAEAKRAAQLTERMRSVLPPPAKGNRSAASN
jgi:flagellar motility protein MotE (MotC chaperone)